MLKKTISYENLDGEQVTEDFYFNMTKAELVKMALSEGEGFQDYITKIVESGDGVAIIETFDKFLELSYGEKTADGKFVKSPKAFEAFKATEAYSEFFMELVTDAKKSSEFINAIMPSNLVAEVQAQAAQVQASQPVTQNVFALKGTITEKAEPAEELSDAELLAAMGVEEAELLTNGLTDYQIKSMSPANLRNQPREVLLRAYQLRNK